MESNVTTVECQRPGHSDMTCAFVCVCVCVLGGRG